MKRFTITILLFILSFGILFAGGEKETAEKGAAAPIKIIILAGADAPLFGEEGKMARALRLAQVKFPTLEIEHKKIDFSTGAPVTMDTLIASGQAPDIYIDWMGRVSRYMVPEFALPLDDLLDTTKFINVDGLKRNGQLIALPDNGSAQGMAINLDLLAKVGYEIPDNWTLRDFLEMCEAVKNYSNVTGEDVYGTGLFAGNQSGDYLWMNWFAVFDVDLYSDGFTKSTADIRGASVWAFFKGLQKYGYIPPNSASLVDDDYVLQWAGGQLAATAFYEPWMAPYFKTVIEQGIIDEPFNYMFVSFPNNAAACNSYAAVVVNKDTKHPEAVGEFLKYYTDVEVFNKGVVDGITLSYRSDTTATNDNPRVNEISNIVAQNGMYDLGISNSWFSEVRAEGYPILQKVLTGKLTPTEAAEAYAKAVNLIIQ